MLVDCWLINEAFQLCTPYTIKILSVSWNAFGYTNVADCYVIICNLCIYRNGPNILQLYQCIGLATDLACLRGDIAPWRRQMDDELELHALRTDIHVMMSVLQLWRRSPDHPPQTPNQCQANISMIRHHPQMIRGTTVEDGSSPRTGVDECMFAKCNCNSFNDEARLCFGSAPPTPRLLSMMAVVMQ